MLPIDVDRVAEPNQPHPQPIKMEDHLQQLLNAVEKRERETSMNSSDALQVKNIAEADEPVDQEEDQATNM